MAVIKLDIDLNHNYIKNLGLNDKICDEWVKEFILTRKILLDIYGIEVEQMNYKKTEHGYHIWFNVKNDLDNETVIRLQFILGDDHHRATFNLIRLLLDKDKSPIFNYFFTQKFKKEVENNESE
jgi:hypothetical protein